jgi:WD40 repeat protein/serine/threonine protein kinase/orotate phosphoribosyltransferase
MQEELLSLLAPRQGHFRLESGHHGDLWLEIPRLYLQPGRLRPFAVELARRLAAHGIKAVCGPLVEGSFLAQMVAEELDVEFFFAEQFARPQGDGLYPVGYRIPDVLQPIVRGKIIAVVDDVINAGFAVRGAFAALKSCGARPVAIGALLVLGPPGSSFAASEGVELESLASLPNRLWEPSSCPLCTSGVPLEGQDFGKTGQAERDEVGPIVSEQLSATVAYHGSGVSTENRDGPDRANPRFPIVRPHAQGGLGEVFLALDPELDRQVALKELRVDRAFDPVSQARFLLEAKVTGRLEHPGIVPVYGLGQYADGRPYYAMRFIEGETLKQAIERFHGPEGASRQPGDREIAFRRLLRSLIDACNAVAYAHSRGVVHRDLKPENIMLGRFGETLVVDWGIAKSFAEPGDESADGDSVDPRVDEDDSSLTRPGSAIGTPQYMSPEQAAGQLDRVGPASDVYSLGATLYCLLVGHGPFPTGGVADVLPRVQRGVFPAPRRLRRSIDPALEAICLKAMARQPEDRHATPMALAEGIEAWMADVRYRSEQEQAIHDVKKSLTRLCIERAHNLFGREMHDEGMLWLARALESIPTDSPGLERAVRVSLAGWHAAAKLMERCLAHQGIVHGVAFSPDGRSLATVCADGTARLWDLAKGEPLSSPMHHEGAVLTIAFSPDGRMIATAGEDGSLRRWDAVTGTPIGVSIRQEVPITAVCFSPDGSKVATASRADLPGLWDAATGQPIGGTSPAGHGARILTIAFHPDGTRLVSADEDGWIGFQETETGRALDQILRHDAAVAALAFSPDGRTLLTGCRDGRARLWDTAQWGLAAELAHQAEVGRVAFSPAGGSVATACHDGTARIWDVHTGKPIGELLAHRACVDCLAFNHDGSIVATGSRDGSVRLWDAGTGLPIGPPLEHRAAVHELAFNSNGQRLATACSDGMARCWRVPAPAAGAAERIVCWVRVATELEFDEGDAIRRIDPLVLWELRRRLQELGGPPVK